MVPFTVGTPPEASMNRRWLLICPEAPVTATCTVFFQLRVRAGSSYDRNDQGNDGVKVFGIGEWRTEHSACVIIMHAGAACYARMRSTVGCTCSQGALTYVGHIIRQPEDTVLLRRTFSRNSWGRSGNLHKPRQWGGRFSPACAESSGGKRSVWAAAGNVGSSPSLACPELDKLQLP